jgi:hypothetical protein
MYIDPLGLRMADPSGDENSNIIYQEPLPWRPAGPETINGTWGGFSHFINGGGDAARYSREMMDRVQKLIAVNNALNDFDYALANVSKAHGVCGETHHYKEQLGGRISNSLYPFDPEEGAMTMEDAVVGTTIGGFNISMSASCEVNCNSRKEKLPESNDNGCYCLCRYKCQIKVTVNDKYSFWGSNNVGLSPLELVGKDYDVSGSFTRSTAGSFYQSW